MKYVVLIIPCAIFNLVAMVASNVWYGVNPEQCNVTIPQDISLCAKKDDDYPCNSHPSPRCAVSWTESHMDLFPHTYIIEGIINVSMHICCNYCKQRLNTNNITTTKELVDRLYNGTENSEFIYAILGTKSTTRLYNRYFIPIIDVPKATLVTRRKNGTVIMENIIESCFNLLPLLAICILMALASGFIIWALDTWYNEEQFPRNFIYGIYEGFWWAFISMTTVGYGDKAPVSICARVFGVLWIVVGITICSMFTASLTAVITNAGLPPTTDIAGKKIIVIENRLLDASFVLSTGGIIYKALPADKIDDVLSNDEQVHGFITDYITAANLRKFFPNLAKKYDFQDMDFSSSEHSYGILIKSKDLYDFMRQFFKENRMFYTNCNIQFLNEGVMRKTLSSDPFHPDNGAFWIALLAISTICAVFLLFGIVFECVRRHREKNFAVDTLSNDTEMLHDIKMLLEKWKSAKKDGKNQIA